MYRWANSEQSAIRRESDGAIIPADARNTDYRRIVDGVPASQFSEAIPPAEILPFQRFAALDEAKVARLGELAHRRWLAEQNFSFGGVSLALDDGTQRRIGGAIQYLQLSEETSVRWQVARGVFATFSAEQMAALGVAAGAHVQACFANVETLAGLIEAAETIADVEAVDLEQGWP